MKCDFWDDMYYKKEWNKEIKSDGWRWGWDSYYFRNVSREVVSVEVTFE